MRGKSRKPLQTKFCEACGATMVFLQGSAGRWVPTDVASVDADDRTFDPSRHVSHWQTCPEADRFRTRGVSR